MSIPTFNDATDEEQFQDIRCYLKGLGADISEENSPEGALVDMEQVISVCDYIIREANEDAESILNNIVALLIVIPADASEQFVHTFCEKLTKAPNLKMANVCFRVLMNLYAGVPEHSHLRYDIYCSLIRVSGQTDNVNAIFKDVAKLKSWLQQLNISVDKTQKILRLLHEVLVECKQSESSASKVMIELLGTYTEDNASQARDDAHKCIVTSLADPNTFLLDHLLVLKPVRFLEGELIHDLLTIFVSEKLSSYLSFYAAHKDFIDTLTLRHDQNMKKMRLLTFMQMAESRKEIPFSAIESELQLKPHEVEGFIIDVIGTKLVRAKMDELQQRVLVSSTMHRTFGRPQWQQLREILTERQRELTQVHSQLHAVLRENLIENVATLQG